MKWLATHYAQTTSLLLAFVAVTGFGSRVLAGEPIVFGNEKTKLSPAGEKTPLPNPFRLEKLTTAPFDFGNMTPPILPRLHNAKKDKRQQNAEDEKKNWMMLEKGELQDKDDEQNYLGIREEKIDDLDKGKDAHDYTFRDTKSSRIPGHLHGPSQHGKGDPGQPSPARGNLDEDLEGKRAPVSSAILFGTGEKEPGGHTGGEFGLKNLLDRDRSPGKASVSLGALFNGGAPQSSREQEASVERFKQILGGSQRSSSDPINFRSDFTRQPLNPVTPSSFGDSGTKSFVADAPAFRQTVAPANNSVNYPGSPDVNSSPSSFAPPPSAPGYLWRPTEVHWPKSKF